jgi:DNA-binding SARP family transcriptional activator
MTTLHLDLLGSVSAFREGGPTAFRTRKSFALLVYLAVEGRPQRRERLADLFWPDAGAESARASLRTAVLYMRAGLGPAADEVLEVTREHIGIRPGAPLQVDVDELRAAQRSARAGALPTGGWCGVQAAVDAYKGAFMAEFSLPDAPEFESWLESQRVKWLGLVSELVDALGAHYAGGDDRIAELGILERKVALTPADHEGWRQLIQHHLNHRDRAAARRAWTAFVAAAEVDDQPISEVMRVLHRQINIRDLDVTSPTTATGGRRHRATPFVGRAREWCQLYASLDRVRRGATEIVVLTGAAGSGKTRLAEQFAESVRGPGADVLAGRGIDVAGELPYAAVIGALRKRLDAENAPDDLLGDLWLSHLARLLPELRERYPDLAEPAEEPGVQRLLLFEAVVKLGQALARSRPLVFWLDDAQWAGAPTHDLLLYLVRRWSESGTPALVVVSARSEDVVSNPEFSRWLSGLEREADCTAIELEALQQEDFAELAAILTGTEEALEKAPEVIALGRHIAQKTGGLPHNLHPVLVSVYAGGLLEPAVGAR